MAEILPDIGVELGRLGPIVLKELLVRVGGIYVIFTMFKVIVSTLNIRYTLREEEEE